jgi:hypothetical protein
MVKAFIVSGEYRDRFHGNCRAALRGRLRWHILLKDLAFNERGGHGVPLQLVLQAYCLRAKVCYKSPSPGRNRHGNLHFC